jgi:hypothetical protein
MLSFYADESGSTGQGQGDWVALLAVGFADDQWKPIKDSLDALKRRYFPAWNLDEVELKSVYLRRWNLAHQKWPPNAFVTLNEAEVTRFGQDLYALIDTLPIEWAAVAFSKEYMLRTYGISASRDIFFRLYMFLLERLHGWCTRENTVGRIFLDQQLVNATHDEIIIGFAVADKTSMEFVGWSNVASRAGFRNGREPYRGEPLDKPHSPWLEEKRTA